MPSIDEITIQQLSRLIGLPGAPGLIDVRPAPACGAHPQLLPTSRSLSADTIENWGPSCRGARVVIYCCDGGDLSQGAAAWLRNEAVQAEVLAGGFDAWLLAGQPLLRPDNIPARDAR